MKKWALAYFFLMMLSLISTAQPKYIQYYNEINLAELAICDGNWKSASNYYQKVFSVNPSKPFTKDLLNAFFAAMDDKQYAIAEKYLASILKRGLDKQFIDTKILKYYSNDDYTKIQTMLLNNRNDSIRKHPLIKELNEMMDWDQDVRKYYSALNDGKYMTDSVYDVDEANANHLRKIFLKFSVPNETMLGNNDNYNHNGVKYWQVIIYHHNAGHLGGKSSHTLDSFLYKAVLNFDYNLHDFETMINSNNIFGYFNYQNFSVTLPTRIIGAYYKGKFYSEYFDDPSEQLINEQRKKIGLESLDDLRKKIEAKNNSENTALQKYTLPTLGLVMDANDEKSLNDWLSKNGKYATKRKSIKFQTFEIGNIGNWYIINKTTTTDYSNSFKNYNKEYRQGTIQYDEWQKTKTTLPFNYHAEIVANPNLDKSSDYYYQSNALSDKHYRLFIQSGFSFESIGSSRNIELLFFDDTLVCFKANVVAGFDNMMNRRWGKPTKTTLLKDTIVCKATEQIISVVTKKCDWSNKEITSSYLLEETIDKQCKKKTTATLMMFNEKKYKQYLKLIEDTSQTK